jgi:hypothetical protein
MQSSWKHCSVITNFRREALLVRHLPTGWLVARVCPRSQQLNRRSDVRIWLQSHHSCKLRTSFIVEENWSLSMPFPGAATTTTYVHVSKLLSYGRRGNFISWMFKHQDSSQPSCSRRSWLRALPKLQDRAVWRICEELRSIHGLVFGLVWKGVFKFSDSVFFLWRAS